MSSKLNKLSKNNNDLESKLEEFKNELIGEFKNDLIDEIKDKIMNEFMVDFENKANDILGDQEKKNYSIIRMSISTLNFI